MYMWKQLLRAVIKTKDLIRFLIYRRNSVRNTWLYTSRLADYALFSLQADTDTFVQVSTSDGKAQQDRFQTRPVCQSSPYPMHSA
jgi:hypothetical protein